jgi:putative ABC transport system permease protein
VAITILISAYVFDEISYDKFHRDQHNLYRVTSASHFNGNTNSYSRTPLSLAERLSELKSIARAARIFERNATISIPDAETKFNEPHVWFADAAITDVLDFSALQGNLTSALSKPNTVIISKDAAIKFFNTVEVIGKTLLVENRIPLQIEAVVENYPDQSTLQFDFIAPFNHFLELENSANVEFLTTDWLYTPVFTLVKVNPSTSSAQLNEDLKDIVKTIPDERARENISYSAQRMPTPRVSARVMSQPPARISTWP